MCWLGGDGLNYLCEGAGEGTVAPAKTARPSALPPGGPEPEVSRAAQPSVLPTEAPGGMCACRLSALFVVRGAWVAPPPARQGSSSGERAGVPLCAGDPADSSRKPQQLLAAASQNVSPSPRRHAVWWRVELGSTFSVREQKGGGGRATRRAGGITGAPHQVFKDGGSMAPGAAPGSRWSAGDAPPCVARKFIRGVVGGAPTSPPVAPSGRSDGGAHGRSSSSLRPLPGGATRGSAHHAGRVGGAPTSPPWVARGRAGGGARCRSPIV